MEQMTKEEKVELYLYRHKETHQPYIVIQVKDFKTTANEIVVLCSTEQLEEELEVQS